MEHYYSENQAGWHEDSSCVILQNNVIGVYTCTGLPWQWPLSQQVRQADGYLNQMWSRLVGLILCCQLDWLRDAQIVGKTLCPEHLWRCLDRLAFDSVDWSICSTITSVGGYIQCFEGSTETKGGGRWIHALLPVLRSLTSPAPGHQKLQVLSLHPGTYISSQSLT